MNINFNNMNFDMKRLFDKYAIFTDGEDSISIDYLAAAVSVSPKTAFAELQTLVVMGYFGREAYIDYFAKRLIIRNSAKSGAAKQDFNFSADNFVNNIKNTVAGNMRAGSSGGAKRAPAKKETPAAPVISQKPYAKKGKLRVMMVFGIIFLIGAAGIMPDLISSLFTPLFWENLFAAGLSAGIAAFLLIRRSRLQKLNSHFGAYRTIIGTKPYIALDDIAGASGVHPSAVKNDLQKFIDKGLLGKEAYIDHSAGNLVLSGGAYAKYKPAEDVSAKEKSTGDDSGASTAKEAGSQYYDIIKEIRELNDAIPDPDVSERIYKIEEITAKIFQIVEEKPEKLPEIRSFMSYYLPTTLKLLRSYAVLDRQGVNGENINASKQNIEKVLDNVVKGFSRQLDQLFKSEYLDISTDIEVLESMMAKDGLSEDGGFQFKTKQQ